MSNSLLKETRTYHFALVEPRTVTFPMKAEDFLEVALCGKATGVIPQTFFADLATHSYTTWFSLDEALVDCQECLEWIHA